MTTGGRGVHFVKKAYTFAQENFAGMLIPKIVGILKF